MCIFLSKVRCTVVEKGRVKVSTLSMVKHQTGVKLIQHSIGQKKSHGQTQNQKAENLTPVRGITKPYAKGAWIRKGYRIETTNAINLTYLM